MVSIYECSSFASMSMKIHVEIKLTRQWKISPFPTLHHRHLSFCEISILRFDLFDDFFNSINRWLLKKIWIIIMTVEVLPKCIKSVVSSCNTIRIQHWDYFNYEMIQQSECSRIHIVWVNICSTSFRICLVFTWC